MKHYQNTLTGEVVSEDECSYAAGRTELDEDGRLCYWDDVKDIVRELEELKSAVVASLILLPKDNDGKRLLEDALRFGA